MNVEHVWLRTMHAVAKSEQHEGTGSTAHLYTTSLLNSRDQRIYIILSPYLVAAALATLWCSVRGQIRFRKGWNFWIQTCCEGPFGHDQAAKHRTHEALHDLLVG